MTVFAYAYSGFVIDGSLLYALVAVLLDWLFVLRLLICFGLLLGFVICFLCFVLIV